MWDAVWTHVICMCMWAHHRARGREARGDELRTCDATLRTRDAAAPSHAGSGGTTVPIDKAQPVPPRGSARPDDGPDCCGLVAHSVSWKCLRRKPISLGDGRSYARRSGVVRSARAGARRQRVSGLAAECRTREQRGVAVRGRAARLTPASHRTELGQHLAAGSPRARKSRGHTAYPADCASRPLSSSGTGSSRPP